MSAVHTVAKTASAAAAIAVAIVTVLTVTVLAGCETTPTHMVQGEPYRWYYGEDFDMRLRFLDENLLRERYGRRNNTFIAPAGLGRERFLPFDLDIFTDVEQAVTIRLSEIELAMGGRTYRPQNRFHFGNYWERRDRSDGTRGSLARQRQQEIRRVLLDNQITVREVSSDQGMVLFRGSFPRYGTARITVPVRDRQGRELERAEFEFEF